MTKMGSISQIKQENAPQTAGRHQNAHEIHLQRLVGDWQWKNSGNSVLFVQRCSIFPSPCLETEAQREQEEPPLVCPVPCKSETSSLWTWIWANSLEERVEEHWALVCCFSKALTHPWPPSQSYNVEKSWWYAGCHWANRQDWNGFLSIAQGGCKRCQSRANSRREKISINVYYVHNKDQQPCVSTASPTQMCGIHYWALNVQ